MTAITNYELGQSTAIEVPERPVRVKHVKKRNQAGVFEDYIPTRVGPRFGPKPSKLESARAAYDATIRRQEANRAASKSHMTDKLAKMNAATAVEFIEKQPSAVKEQYLVAEEEGQARKAVLSHFPRAGKLARGESTSAENDLVIAEWKEKARELRVHAPIAVPEEDVVEGAVVLQAAPEATGPATTSDEEFAALSAATADDDGMAQAEE